jgi:hypothetical protein
VEIPSDEEIAENMEIIKTTYPPLLGAWCIRRILLSISGY